MADDRIQELYDRAFSKWQEKNREEATALIEEALVLSPNDPALHALAFHIKRLDRFDSDCAFHAERILDIDVHYRDILDGKKNGRDFAELMMLQYPLLISHAEDRWNKDPLKEKPSIEDKRAEERRMVTYGTKLLKAGYGIPNLDNFAESLADLDMHDVVIDIGLCLAGLKTSAEIGLPGLDHSDDSDFFDPIEYLVAESFRAAGRDLEALEWCKALIAKEPTDWGYHGILGEICCRLGHPAEAARQWIISYQKGAHEEFLESNFSGLCNMTADPNAARKGALWQRVYEMKPKLSPDKTGILDKLLVEIHGSIGDPKHAILEESYIAHKLEAELPDLRPGHFYQYENIWLPNQGPYPFAPKSPEPEAAAAEAAEAEPAAVTARSACAPRTIESLGVDLTERATDGKLPPIVGRDKEIDALVRILLRMEKNNPVLLGEAGVGKTAVLQGLAQRIVSDNVPECLRGRRVIEISMSALVSGTMWRGDFESRITNLIQEARENPEIILFIDELHTIMGAGAAKQGDLDAANIVKPALAKGELRLVGATTNEEYAKYIEKDPAMARRFTPVKVPELDRKAVLEVLKARRNFWQEAHHIEISDELLSLAVELTGLHVTHRRFPDKAIDLLDESAALAETRRDRDGNGIGLVLTEGEVRRVLSEWTGSAGSPTETVEQNGDRRGRLPSKSHIETAIQARFSDSGADIGALSELVAQMRLSFKNPSRPLAALFHGPARSGKTTCVNAVAEVLWPGESDRVLTLNLSNYTDAAGLGRLIGAPPGFPGANEQGLLTARLRRQPYGIVLLKNIEAAHPKVIEFFNDTLQSGRYSDNRRGAPVSTADSLFVLHLDMETLTRPVGFHHEKALNAFNDAGPTLKRLKSLGIEFPFTHVVGFAPLLNDSARAVIRMHLDNLQKAYSEKGLRFVFADSLVERLAENLMSLPVEKRDVSGMIDAEIRPRIRHVLLENNFENLTKEISIE